MTNDLIVKAIASTGVGGMALFVLYKVLMRVADRFIAALDGITASLKATDKTIADHTEKDLAHHAEVREAVVRLDAKVDSVINWREQTPPELPRRAGTDSERVRKQSLRVLNRKNED